jgi:hypothetical protein
MAIQVPKASSPLELPHTLIILTTYSTGAQLLMCQCGRLLAVQYEPDQVIIVLEPGSAPDANHPIKTGRVQIGEVDNGE